MDIVVKFGGGVLAHPAHFGEALMALDETAASRPLLVVPGGGPFADAVRQVDRRLRLDDSAAHWMAVLAMDQYGHLLASRLRTAEVVLDLDGARAALTRGRVPVLAPFRWLRQLDPLPHSWDVTSDSIAAWVAGMVGARRLVLVKPPGVDASAVDRYFSHALPANLSTDIVPADQIGTFLRSVTV